MAQIQFCKAQLKKKKAHIWMYSEVERKGSLELPQFDLFYP